MGSLESMAGAVGCNDCQVQHLGVRPIGYPRISSEMLGYGRISSEIFGDFGYLFDSLINIS